MLGRTVQTGNCVCRYLQQCFQMSNVLSTRGVHHNNTRVFERLWDVNMVGKGKQPRVKPRNRVLITQYPQIVSKKIKCILTKEIEDLGYKGAIVEVPKTVFRYELYPKGLAIYASPENIAENEEYLKSEEAQKYKGIHIQAKGLMMKLSGLHLRIPMNGENAWELNKSHIRVACRHIGLMMKDDNVILPEEPVTQPGEIVFGVCLDGRLQTQVRGTVYLAADNEPIDPSITFPELWNNPPVNKELPIQYINQTNETDISSQEER